jgi:2-oxoglutarate dehydrogenase E2 component (dihydrolipoamide succinyltransferase)
MSLVEIKVPQLAESISEATIMNWSKSAGEWVNVDEKIVDIETDKVVLEVVATQAGVLSQVIKNIGELVASDEVVGYINPNATSEVSAAPAAKPTVEPTPTPVVVEPKTSPAVRKITEEQGISPAQVPHSGDRVTKADVLAHVAPPAPIAAPIIQTAPRLVPSTPLPDAQGRKQERVPMTRLRKRVSERLLSAQHEHALLTTFNEINMKPAMDLRSKYKDQFEKMHGTKLGFMSFFVKAAIAGLQKFPIINASTEGSDIVYHGFYDIGIAVSSPRGLVVPILHDADKMSFANVEKSIATYGAKARDNKLELSDLEGGTFSITNGGIFGSMMSTPILNPPQSAILGMHNIVDRPIAENGQVVIRPIMYVALTYDHRIIDGREAVQFLFNVKQYLEDPQRLLLDL